MKRSALGALLLACTSLTAPAALLTFDSNATVAVAQGAIPTTLAVHFGVLEDVYDGDFNLIGQSWVEDTAPLDPITELPSMAGYGTSTTNRALNGIYQPILIVFGQTLNISAFSVFLDDSTLGNLFPTPIQFLDAAGNVVGSVNTQQNIASYEATGTNLNGVKTILLPSGAMYDNMTINGTVVPEPASALLAAGGLCTLGLRRRRRK